eukprot:TRINITY_DN3868_c0_g1_i1.p1 TRINITY_DN3868_c0_g1~~TRINITY_DN3868_c0_g1_i1.p1  ORF type:complete len:109 (+),score=8.21 TRINITY_DN3868_c0_g1_i1:34-327(+)
MSTRCSYCNNPILFGEVRDGDRVYHEKCKASAVASRVEVATTSAIKVEEERQKKAEAQAKMPAIIGTIDVGAGKGGMTVDPRSGDVKYYKAYGESKK